MGIRLAKTAGFCWGVKRAVDLALRVAHERTGRILTFGPLIHNRQALDLLRTKGIDQLPKEGEGNADSPRAAASGQGDRVAPPIIIRAHGATPEVKQSLVERGFEVIDATCPHVGRTQRIVERQAAEGCQVLIVGDRGHAEVEGLLGYARGRGWVVEKADDVAGLPADLGKICVVAQTTQGGDRFERCVEAIRARYGEVEVFNTRCNDTNNRQGELFDLASEVEAIIVVGGRGSANTTRLADLARERGVPTWHIETADELPLDELRHFDEIGVTAGASTPHWIIEQVVDRLRALQRRRRPFVLRAASALARLLIIGQIALATGAAALALAAAHLMRIGYRLEYSALPFLYLGAMHLLHQCATLPHDLSLTSGPARALAVHKRAALGAGLASLVVALALSALMGPWVFTLVGLSTLIGGVYSFGAIPRGWFPQFRFRRLHQIPGSKDLCGALAWAMLIVIVPWVHVHGPASLSWPSLAALALTATFVFGLSLVRSLTADVREIEGDLLLGRETLPVFVGRGPTHRLMTVILAGLGLLALVSGLLVEPFLNGLILLAPVALMALAYWLTYQQKIRSHLVWSFLLDLPFLVGGGLSLI
jgi:4-hydroxy-3-methylbut-2-enyl diphosphate reductase